MAVYWAVLKRGESEASDSNFNANIGSKPTESSEIRSKAVFATVVEVEAATEAEAARAVRIAYPGRANTKIIIVPEAEWKEI